MNMMQTKNNDTNNEDRSKRTPAKISWSDDMCSRV